MCKLVCAKFHRIFMARIVFAVFGSLGDLHPHVALALELKRRGHSIAFATLDYYREKIKLLGFEFFPMRPNVTPEDKDLAREFMNAKTGTEKLLRELLIPTIAEAYEDLTVAVQNADLLVSSEVAFAAPLIAEKTGMRWVTTTLAPTGFLSVYDPFVPPTMTWLENLRFLGASFHKILYIPVNRMLWSWGDPIREFRRKLGLRSEVEPIFGTKFSSLLNLALFSRVLGEPQPDWHPSTVQCGFAFYDGQKDSGQMPEKLREFLTAGDAPIVFTLGSAAVWTAEDFFSEAARAAKALNRRAVLILGENEPPPDLDENFAVFDYAPYSEVFPRAAAVVHQGGVGTTGQVLRAGVPALFVPFSHDQPDNAARCVRFGLARVVPRAKYNAARAAKELSLLLANAEYKRKAEAAKTIVSSENGVKSACDEIEKVLINGK